jgi:hypothetical protein
MMNRGLMILALVMLGGCSSHVALTGQDDVEATVGILVPTWLEPQSMEVLLDGKRYVGEWSSSACFTDECRGVFRNVLRIHRRHIRKGEAVLAAPDGGRLECRWVSYPPKMDGICRTQDGRVYKLKVAKATYAAELAKSTA